MGFLSSVRKMLLGSPPARPDQQVGVPAPNPAAPPKPRWTGKVIPVVVFERVKTHHNGKRLDIYAEIENRSKELIFLDRVFFLGAKRELDTELKAGQSRQFIVYSGPPFNGEPRGYVELEYRKQVDGDYFATHHEVRSHRQRDGSYEITELIMRGPTKDI